MAPIDDAVTLTTPAGSSGRHWPLVWIPAIQQGIWPNLAARNTMFGGEDLADVMLYGGLSDDSGEHGDNKLESVLYAEQKSLLVALTRASEQVTASAVYNDDLTPSDFLYGYIPERFNRERHASAEGREYTQVGEAGRLQGLDADPRGLVAAARVALAVHPRGSKESQDAVDALRLLANNGVEAADITRWPFLDEVEDASSGSRTVGSRAAASEPEKAAWREPANHGAADRNIVAIRRGQHLGMSRLLDDGKPVHWSARRQCGDLVRLSDPRRRRNRQQRGPGRGGLAR